ncbi:hypothetical protein D3H65_11190 [Paraflavitalea soli]|uniref:Uncharacterized protein n=1 Tax=Paraflavitalea soli TaxID=2315862 RepID=A0A3B7MK00_9BACT|nr:hypothetical protein D3H65_11190 [Paraflavitalea soli]
MLLRQSAGSHLIIGRYQLRGSLLSVRSITIYRFYETNPLPLIYIGKLSMISSLRMHIEVNEMLIEGIKRQQGKEA